MDVLVIAEQRAGVLRKASFSAAAAGRALAARTGGKLHLALLGRNLSALGEPLARCGAQAVHLLDDPGLEPSVAETAAQAIAGLCRRLGTRWVLAASSAFSRDCLPRVATLLDAGMASDVIGFDGSGEAVALQRPMWAGNAIAEVEITTPTRVLTVRATDFAPAPPSSSACPILSAQVELGPAPKAKVLGMHPVTSGRPELTEARVVVAGGRGTRGDFSGVEALADALGAAVGATRAAVDAGWAPNDVQIGQTGKVVAPDLYIGAGISGAIQHVAGIKGSRVIVAINKDPEAALFQVADYGLVADLFQALPALAAELTRSGR